MTDGRAQLLAQYPNMKFLDGGEPVKVLAAANDGVKLQARTEDGKLRIRALASTPTVNAYGFKIDQRAFVDAIPAFRLNPVMLAYHRMDWPVGRWDLSLSVSPEGFVAQGWVSAAEPAIQEKVLDGTLGRVSVAFLPLAWEEEDGQPMVITKLRLFEISLVPIPADAGTMVEPLADTPPASLETAQPLAQEQDKDEDADVLVLGVADACRVTLGVMDTIGRASRIAAGLRRETIRKGNGDE
jgi:HK97 family phage prohead protease